MRTCLPVAILLAPLFGLAAMPALAVPGRYHVGRTVYGCVDPEAAVALDGQAGRQAGLDQARMVRQSGRCFRLWPALPLDVISRHAGLALVRRVPPRVGEPPLFVPEREVQTLRPPVPPPTPQAVVPPPPMAGRNAPPSPSPQPGPAVVTVGSTGGDDGREPPDPVPARVPDPGDRAKAADPDPAPSSGPAASVALPSAPVAAMPIVPAPATPAPVAAPPASASPGPPAVVMVPASPPSSPLPTAPWPPAPRPPASLIDRGSVLIGLGLVLLLIAAVVGALLVARRRRHFAHVEEPADWPPEDRDRVVEPRPAPAAAVPTAAEFRKHCAAALSSAGWATQLAFQGDGSGPDIVARRDATVAAIRCRASNTAVTGEMVDEAAVMGARHGATMTLLASNAPFSQRAQDEALRHGIRLLRDTELTDFVG